MSYKTLAVSRHDAVTRIAMNRPEKLNALGRDLLLELQAALQTAADDPDCRCVLLTGEGRGFSSGADLTDTAVNLSPGQAFDFGAALESSYHPVVRIIRNMDKPVVAAVNGVAAGAGCNIALAADLVIAARSAKFLQAFVRIGLVPDASGTWTIPRLIGRARALRWMMSGESISAETAENWGLISEVLDDEEFAAAAMSRAQGLAAQPTLALAAIKHLVDASTECDLEQQLALEAEAQSRVGYSGDTMEGIMAFIQKRKAQFKGK